MSEINWQEKARVLEEGVNAVIKEAKLAIERDECEIECELVIEALKRALDLSKD